MYWNTGGTSKESFEYSLQGQLFRRVHYSNDHEVPTAAGTLPNIWCTDIFVAAGLDVLIPYAAVRCNTETKQTKQIITVCNFRKLETSHVVVLFIAHRTVLWISQG